MEALWLCFAFCLIRSALGTSEGVPWDYVDTSSWKDHYPLCAATHESPVNVVESDCKINHNVCDAQFDWTVDDHKLFKVKNNGHSLQLYAVKEIKTADYPLRRRLFASSDDLHLILNLNTNTIARHSNYFGPSDGPHKEYCLDSFHMHWGKDSNYGSEHTINDIHYPLEMHFVHFACEYDTLSDALDNYKQSGDPNVLSVVSILYEISADNNPAFDIILSDDVISSVIKPDDPNTNMIEGYTYIDGLQLDDIIPRGVYTSGYFHYDGSLTTPPCYDVVRWNLMKAKGTISEEQISQLRKLETLGGASIAPNYREVQNNVNDINLCVDEGTIDRSKSGAQNCYKCGSVNGCMAECNNVSKKYKLKGSWRECKRYCGAMRPARSKKGKCAIWHKQRCYCASGCDNIKGNNVYPSTPDDIFDPVDDTDYIFNNPADDINNDKYDFNLETALFEGYTIGVISTLFILIVGVCLYIKIKQDSNQKV